MTHKMQIFLEGVVVVSTVDQVCFDITYLMGLWYFRSVSATKHEYVMGDSFCIYKSMG